MELGSVPGLSLANNVLKLPLTSRFRVKESCGRVQTTTVTTEMRTGTLHIAREVMQTVCVILTRPPLTWVAAAHKTVAGLRRTLIGSSPPVKEVGVAIIMEHHPLNVTKMLVQTWW